MREIFSRVTVHKLPFLLLVQPTTTTTTSSSSSSSPSRRKEEEEEQEQEKKQVEEGEEEEKEEKVVGYAYLSPYNPHREAYAATTELSIYLSPQTTRSGFGSLLLKALLDKLRAKKEDELAPGEGREMGWVKEIVVGMSIFEGDPGRFYERMGFRPVGVFERLGWKFGRWVDVKFFQLSLPEGEGGDGI